MVNTDFFSKYVERVTTELGDKIDTICTINEANLTAQHFFRFPNNGVTKLCDLLKSIQLSQTHHQAGSGPHNSQAAIRTVQSDEFQTLLCLKVWPWSKLDTSKHHLSSFFSKELQFLFGAVVCPQVFICSKICHACPHRNKGEEFSQKI